MQGSASEKDTSEALGRRFRAFSSALQAWFRKRVLDPVEAEDLAQESFLRIAQRGEDEEVDHFEGYLYRTAGSVLADRRRRRAVRHAGAHVSYEPEHDPGEEAEALRVLLAREKLQQVSAVLMTLPERTRTVFVLRRVEGLRYGEIAARFGISTSAVQKHMARALEALAKAPEDAR
jgi:RNA polymerase sigma factor (sigma-70 family)